MAEPNGNYIEHCHWLLAFPLSVTSTYSFSSRSWRVILSGYANCDRRSERELYRTLSLAACASAKCHDHPFVQQPSRKRNSFGVRKLWPQSRTRTISNTVIGCLRFRRVTSTHSLSSRSGHVILSGWANCDRMTETCLHGPWIILETVKWMLKMWIMPLLAFDYLTVTVSLSVR